jgi:cell division septation protein DedD
MKTTIYKVVFSSMMLMLFTVGFDSVYSQEGSSTNLKLTPSQERIPQTGEPRIPPEYFIPPIESPSYSPPPVSRNPPPSRAPLVSSLERGKWYVQIGAYTRADHVEEAVKRAGTSNPLVIHNAGTDSNPVFRVLLGPFSQSESKAALQRFRNKGYDAFLRNGN